MIKNGILKILKIGFLLEKNKLVIFLLSNIAVDNIERNGKYIFLNIIIYDKNNNQDKINIWLLYSPSLYNDRINIMDLEIWILTNVKLHKEKWIVLHLE